MVFGASAKGLRYECSNATRRLEYLCAVPGYAIATGVVVVVVIDEDNGGDDDDDDMMGGSAYQHFYITKNKDFTQVRE